MSLFGTDAIQDKWRNQHTGAAKRIWDKSAEGDLLQSKGRAPKSLGPVHKRYAILRAEADEQVKTFFHKNTF